MTSNDRKGKVSQSSNTKLAKKVLEEVLSLGVYEFCICAGARNAPLIYPLVNSSHIRIYYWPEERSAAFFALGRIKATGRPLAVVTTSGTASAELLPAAMEAHYTGLPLVLITADRPRRFRGTGAPQATEQSGLFQNYAHEIHDLEGKDECNLKAWKQNGPLHLNVCLEEPEEGESQDVSLDKCVNSFTPAVESFIAPLAYQEFLNSSHFPLVVIGSLHSSQHEAAVCFLLHLNAPVYLEGISGIREDPRLQHLRVTWMENVWQKSAQNHYPIDGILRLGGVPTIRLWRDLEEKKDQIVVCSISDLPFSGLSWANVIQCPLLHFFEWAKRVQSLHLYPFLKWKNADLAAQQALQNLFKEEPYAEQSLIHALTKSIPLGSKVYLGNSLPIREWDLVAVHDPRGFQMASSRGANGIDGQLSTFLGYSSGEQDNWALLGDLTVLYDLAAPWITSQLPSLSINVVVINNGGAGIFKKMFAHPAFLNTHSLSFEPFAEFWKWRYEKWTAVPDRILPAKGARLIELIPDAQATERFLSKLKEI